MTYILMIWTVVAATQGYSKQEPLLQYDWRPVGEFHSNGELFPGKAALAKCEAAASQLGLATNRYRCVKSL